MIFISVDSLKRYERISGLVNYLLKIMQAQRTVVKDVVSAYGSKNIFWLADDVNFSGCIFDIDKDIITVFRQHEPVLPTIPQECLKWIDSDTCASTEMPKLSEYKLELNSSTEGEYSESEYRNAQVVLQRYINDKWIPYKLEYDKWKKNSANYQKLFDMHQTLLKDGELYELVFCLGFFQQKYDNGNVVQRHLLIANAEIELDKIGKLTVRLTHPEGSLRQEFELFDETQNKKVISSIDELLDKDSSITEENISHILESILNLSYPDGKYYGTYKPMQETTNTALITLSPAIILRPRRQDCLRKFLKDIELQEGRSPTYNVFTYLANISHDTTKPQAKTTVEAQNQATDFNGELFFPKPCNDEQKEIVYKINKYNGVVVQGPPGTGKSHTIANLICHLLSTGNRVLVTAKTPTALRVLYDKIPKSIQQLVISMTGNTRKENQSLEHSVKSILSYSNIWNSANDNSRIKEITEKLANFRKEKVAKNRLLRDIIESETKDISVNDKYHGTASKIVKAITSDADKYDWLKDKVQLPHAFSISKPELLDILRKMRLLYPKRTELKKDLSCDILPTEHFAVVISELSTSMQNAPQPCSYFYHLSSLSLSDLFKLFMNLRNLNNKVSWLLGCCNDDWIHKELMKIFNNQDYKYDKILQNVFDCIKKVKIFDSYAFDYSIVYPETWSSRCVYDSIKLLQQYVEDGHSLSWVNLMKPKAIQQALQKLDEIIINGRNASKNSEDLMIILSVLEYECNLSRARDIISELVELPQKAKLKDIENAYTAIKALSEIGSIYLSMKSMIPDEIKLFYDGLDSTIKAFARTVVDHLKESLQNVINNDNAHSVIFRMTNAIKEYDLKMYDNAKVDLESLIKDRNDLLDLEKILEKLKKDIPIMIDEMERTYNDTTWEHRIEGFENACYWMQAKDWVENYITTDEIQEIKLNINCIDDKIRLCIEKLSELKSWNYCIERLTSSQKRHAVLWQQALKKLGKGTGKHAGTHRKEAQSHLEKCTSAIPAWIMPLHTVWDTISASQPGVFDVVIVDEASQCGVDTLPLLYLGKKILIVGDDKQISPENVGLDRSQTKQWSDEYLSCFGELKACFDCDNSLFDIGNVLFNNGQIALREHFRCMPEIIRFSNELCYSQNALIPLKQYGSNRLLPLESVFVQDGYMEGKNDKIRNKPECDMIVSRIEQICADERYKDKSLGVIVLQGKAQVELIQTKLLQKLGSKCFEEHDIICGTPSQFQGNERDIVILSMVVAPASDDLRISFRALTRTQDEQRFNVAMSRAKEQVILFHSVEPYELSPFCLRRRLLEFFYNKESNEVNGISLEKLEKLSCSSRLNRKEISPPNGFDSWFEVDVALEIMRKGYRISTQYEVAGRRIDIVVEGRESRLAVECDGEYWHGADKYDEDMHRQLMLERCGWEFFRIRESEFYYIKDQVMDRLYKTLRDREIFPTVV